jgi:hypothetical protein
MKRIEPSSLGSVELYLPFDLFVSVVLPESSLSSSVCYNVP